MKIVRGEEGERKNDKSTGIEIKCKSLYISISILSHDTYYVLLGKYVEIFNLSVMCTRLNYNDQMIRFVTHKTMKIRVERERERAVFYFCWEG